MKELKIIDVLDEHSKALNLGILTIVTASLSIVMGYFSQQFLILSAGLPVPDMRFGYSFTDIQNLFSIVGKEGLLLYRNIQIIDMYYPLAYSLSFAVGIMILIRNCPERFQAIKVAALVPIVSAIFDYIENILIATQTFSYPTLDETLISIASAFTIMKWSTLLISLILFFALALVAFVTAIRKD